MTEGTRAGDGHATCPLLLQGEFPVREDLSDVTDEDASLAPQPPASKPPGLPFRVKDDVDLFGLGLLETGHKASGSEGSWGPGRRLLTSSVLIPIPLASGAGWPGEAQPGGTCLTPSLCLFTWGSSAVVPREAPPQASLQPAWGPAVFGRHPRLWEQTAGQDWAAGT